MQISKDDNNLLPRGGLNWTGQWIYRTVH